MPDPPLAALVAADSRPRALGALLGRLLARSPALARLVRAPAQARGPATRITRLHARLLRLAGGRLRRSWLFAAGQPVMALTTTGRRSGSRRTTVVSALVHDGRLATVGMNLGAERRPAWSYNLDAHPDAWIAIGGRTIEVRARRAAGEEAAALWERWVQVQPASETLARLSGRRPPIFVLERR